MGRSGLKVCIGVADMWQSPIYSLMRNMDTLANVKIKGNACA